MALKGYVGGAFKSATGVQAYVSGWKPAKSVRLFQNGQWVSVLQTAVTVTRTPATGSVLVGSNVVLVATPSIPSLVQSWEWWYAKDSTTWTKSTVGSVQSWTWIPQSYDVAAAFQWKAVAVQYDGTRVESAPVSIAVTGTSTTSLSGPAYVMSTESAANGSKSLTSPAFVITIGTPSVVTKVSLQQRHVATQSAFTEIKAWTTGITSSLQHISTLAAEGVWETKAVITTAAGAVTSNVVSSDCIKRSVTITTTDANPTIGTQITLTASMSSAAPAGFGNTPIGWEYFENSKWNTWVTTNPIKWTVDRTLDFRWGESFPDGSKIYSNQLTITAKAVVETTITGTGTNTTADLANLQKLLNRAFNEKKELILKGTWYMSGAAYIPPNVDVTATGAVFNAHTGTMFINMGTPAGATVASSDYRATNGGKYNRAGGWTWTGGTMNANNKGGAFSLSHSPGYTIQNVTIYNTDVPGHGIENNSSGGYPSSKRVDSMAESEFTVRILNNTFLGMSMNRRNSNDDEAIHIDYSWIKPDGTLDGFPAASAPVVNDGTVCNKVLVKGNVVKWDKNVCTYSYPVGFGHHHSISSNESCPSNCSLNHAHITRHLPVAPAKQIRIVNNTFQDVVPEADTKGAVHIHTGAKEVIISANTFLRCTRAVTLEPRGVPSSWQSNATETAATLPQYYWITNNTFNACGAGFSGNYNWITTIAFGEGGDRWHNVYITGNLFTGAIPATQTVYLVSTPECDTHSVSNNKFWGLTGGGGSPKLSAQTGNRIHGTESDPAGTSKGFTLSGNTWSSSSTGAAAVAADS